MGWRPASSGPADAVLHGHAARPGGRPLLTGVCSGCRADRRHDGGNAAPARRSACAARSRLLRGHRHPRSVTVNLPEPLQDRSVVDGPLVNGGRPAMRRSCSRRRSCQPATTFPGSTSSPRSTPTSTPDSASWTASRIFGSWSSRAGSTRWDAQVSIRWCWTGQLSEACRRRSGRRRDSTTSSACPGLNDLWASRVCSSGTPGQLLPNGVLIRVAQELRGDDSHGRATCRLRGPRGVQGVNRCCEAAVRGRWV